MFLTCRTGRKKNVNAHLIQVTALCHVYILGWQMGNIYESLAVLVLQQIAGAVGGHGTFYHRPLKQTDRHNDSSLLGSALWVFFGLFNPVLLWNVWVSILQWLPNTTQSHCPWHFHGNMLYYWQACGLPPMIRQALRLELNHTVHLKGYYRLSKCSFVLLLRAQWAQSLYLAQEPAGQEKSTRNPVFPLLTPWQCYTIHSFFYLRLVAVLLPVSRGN